MNKELLFAIEELKCRAFEKAWFIPVRLNECDIPARDIGGGQTLQDLQWVNLYENWNAGIDRILTVIRPQGISAQWTPQAILSFLHGSLTPVAAIRGLAEALQRQVGSQESQTLLDLILFESTRLSYYLRHFGSFVTISELGQRVHKSKTDFASILAEVTRIFRPLVDLNELSIEVRGEEAIPKTLYVDGNLLQQVVFTLLHCSWKLARERNTPAVIIDASRSNAAQLIVMFGDCGPSGSAGESTVFRGRPPQISEDWSLSLARHIAELHDGEMEEVCQAQGSANVAWLLRIPVKRQTEVGS
jgi:K+-sensing histidine kinase KdpD